MNDSTKLIVILIVVVFVLSLISSHVIFREAELKIEYLENLLRTQERYSFDVKEQLDSFAKKIGYEWEQPIYKLTDGGWVKVKK